MEQPSRQRALITGASAGIGEALAIEFARNGHDVVLVARSADKLEALAKRLRTAHGIHAAALCADLLEPGAPERLLQELGLRSLDIGILVNNAGILEAGPFGDMPTTRVLELVQLNVAALTELISGFVPRMIAAGGGRVLNVASVASFQPIAGLAVYAASKAYVLSLTEALSEELRDKRVTFTALCPGFTDTAMVKGAQAGSKGGLNIPAIMLSSPTDVARAGYRALMAGRVIEVPGAMNRLASSWVQYQPRWLVRGLTGRMGRQVERDGT